MNHYQPGILAEIPSHARYLTFSIKPGAQPADALCDLAAETNGEDLVVGLGRSLVEALDAKIPTLGTFPAYEAARVEIPSTPAALWCWLRGSDKGELVNRSRDICQLLSKSFDCIRVIDGFKHVDGRDLSGYEDGTENPEGEEATHAAFETGKAERLNGSSYVAVQTWVHDLNVFKSLSQDEQDNTIGRRLSDNEELSDAPPSAHTKRTEQESFEPEAIVLRRSMPWADAYSEGLNFVAFSKNFYAFEAQLNRMVGAEDGIPDALFNFSKPITGNYFWCPPIKNDQLDFSAINL